ncbi:NAD(P)/FAD-dependent oxidoreductase [Sporolactobacillus sp. CPB3-1]|uniref:NAD(P)/FAD-dependent oxidoreductase n=1 Tax=Sporolactobacillus mangiferae TaxID=2940498 RepID=A0ABT0MD19_9BACL|nr:NAD(P)/FAD-dependent oxidoreductase [Sporolactobacillus mangiferae]MCL1632757.1 NAD(P)/FAD-dependent oxidoreductase [Sporolactobacillus mangiferae]
MNYPLLFSPMKINQLIIKNRGVMTAMGVGLANEDGTASEKSLAYFAERAKGGIGLIITEYTRINEKDGVVSGKQLSMASAKHVKAFKKVADAVHQEGAKIFVQLHHPGRQNVPVFPALWPIGNKLAKVIPGYWKLFYKIMGKQNRSTINDPKMVRFMNKYMPPLKAPSNVPAGLGFSPFGNQRIEPLKIEEIKHLINEFVDAAERVKASGADGVELHAGHGYLLCQFLSPYTNIRTDQYGGSLENRTRIIKEIISGVRTRCGKDFPISVRLTVDEFYEKIGYPEIGIKLPEGVRLAKAIERYGADAINVTIANSDTQALISEPVSYPAGWRQDLVRAVKEAVSIPVIAVGVIRTPEQAEEILASGTQDFIGLARPMLADSQWMKKAKKGESDLISRCISCLVCQECYEENMTKGQPSKCAVNPRACHETGFPLENIRDGKRRKVVIVGAGPAGLTAARELAQRDFDVTVLEKENSAGGQVKLAEAPPLKEKIAWSYIDLEKQAVHAGAEILYRTEATKAKIAAYHPHAVFIGTGAFAFKPGIPGADQDFVYTTTPILEKKLVFSNKRIVVVGSGMTGLETSEMLVEQKNQVTIIEMAENIAPGAFAPNVWDVTERLKKGGVKYMTGRRLVSINDHTVTTVQKNNVREIIAADAVILSLGVKSHNKLAKELMETLPNVKIIGDAVKPGRIADAIHSGFQKARAL